jgi:hypothetical protein
VEGGFGLIGLIVAMLGYVIEHLGDPSGVLVLDETGFLKKGSQRKCVP